MTRLNDATYRSQLLSQRIRQRTDVGLRQLIEKFQQKLNFQPIEDLMISSEAWIYVAQSGIQPRKVFVHPDLLLSHPEASAYYRGIALLPQKRVAELAVPVNSWERKGRQAHVSADKVKKVARLYNTVISSIIEGSTDWTMENGYRNVIATMAIGLDGSMRNVIGKDAEALVKERVSNWLREQQLIVSCNDQNTVFELIKGYMMFYKPEPDIEFQKNGRVVATIEIKGGRDKAGALERLGAMTKSFENTPPGCVNMLIAGVITEEMQNRLQNIGVVKVFLLDDVVIDGPRWISFLNEVFHFTLRMTDEVTQ